MIFACIFMSIASGYAQSEAQERLIEVSLRMIGHQVLLQSADSTSRVLPIVKENDRYRIQFDTEFVLEPQLLVQTVDSVVKTTGLAHRYTLEVEDCKTKDIVYSFKVDDLEQSDIVPCVGRLQPKGCYNLWFSLIEPITTNLVEDNSESTTKSNTFMYVVIGIALLFFALLLFLLWKRKQTNNRDPNLIPLGEYHFDKRNTELLIEEQRIELTGKEAELLLLLYDAVNTTVERDIILNKVWGDEGDYVGRTLDVFISKLRKKLEFDAKVKIVNIRGVGYKLVV